MFTPRITHGNGHLWRDSEELGAWHTLCGAEAGNVPRAVPVIPICPACIEVYETTPQPMTTEDLVTVIDAVLASITGWPREVLKTLKAKLTRPRRWEGPR